MEYMPCVTSISRYTHKLLGECVCCGSILSLVQTLFPLFQTDYHQITITKTKEIKF